MVSHFESVASGLEEWAVWGFEGSLESLLDITAPKGALRPGEEDGRARA